MINCKLHALLQLAHNQHYEAARTAAILECNHGQRMCGPTCEVIGGQVESLDVRILVQDAHITEGVALK